MKVVITYISEDGVPFNDRNVCLKYEALCKEATDLVNSWSSTYNDRSRLVGVKSLEPASIQAVTDSWPKMISLIEKFLILVKPAHVVKDFIDNYQEKLLAEGSKALGSFPYEKFLCWDDHGESTSYDPIYGALWHYEKVDPETGYEYLAPIYWQDKQIKEIFEKDEERDSIEKSSNPS